jgi:hypothetical protein
VCVRACVCLYLCVCAFFVTILVNITLLSLPQALGDMCNEREVVLPTLRYHRRYHHL